MTDATFEYPVELAPVDITPYKKGNTGVDYVTTFDSGVPGFHVMIMAVTHGNELCGALTLDHFFKNNVQPISGKMTFAFSNYEAYQSFDANNPSASRFVEEDMNRVWGEDVLNGERETLEVERARDLCPILDQVDMLLDIHSMQHPTPALMLCGPLAKGQQLAKDLATPEFVVSDKGHAAGTRMRDYGAFGDPMSEKNALLLEAGQHWEKSSEAVSIDTALRFLKLFGTIDMDTLMEDHLVLPDDQALIEVTHPITITADQFKWESTYTGFECIEDAGTILGWNDDEPVRTPYDDCILIMPNRRLHKGQTAVRLGKRIN